MVWDTKSASVCLKSSRERPLRDNPPIVCSTEEGGGWFEVRGGAPVPHKLGNGATRFARRRDPHHCTFVKFVSLEGADAEAHPTFMQNDVSPK